MNVEKIEKLKRAVNEALDLLFDRQEEDVELSREFEESLKEWADYCKNQRNNNSCPCEDGIDSKACVGCEHSEDGKPEYKPYESVEEFIQDYQERFPTAVPRQAHTMPLIWLRRRAQEKIELAISFRGCEVQLGRGFWGMSELFEYWTYLDGTPVGMEVKEW